MELRVPGMLNHADLAVTATDPGDIRGGAQF